jgi:dTDP-4-amino-4,6-dideoxygalactose transaminase
LMFGLLALGVGPGDEVITPPNSFIASTAAIMHVGARPVFVDVLPDQNIDPERVQAAITQRTKAVMPVHLTGRMADMNAIEAVAARHNLFVIEDAAQSIGSRYADRRSGAFGHVGCFSTHPLKNLNACGDGGFLTTNCGATADRVRLLRNHGLSDRNTAQRFGFVSRMDAIQAAILKFRLQRLDAIIEKRRRNADLYRELLDRRHVFAPPCRQIEFNSFHTMVIQVDRRDELRAHLMNDGIATAIHYPVPIHLQPAAASLGHRAGDFPVAERQATRILSLPIRDSLAEDDVAYVAQSVNAFFARAA